LKDRQTESTEIINHAASRVVNNVNLPSFYPQTLMNIIRAILQPTNLSRNAVINQLQADTVQREELTSKSFVPALSGVNMSLRQVT